MVTFIHWAIGVVKKAIRLNVFDLSYFYLPQNINHMLALPSGLPKRGIMIRIGAFLWHMFNSIWRQPLISGDIKHNAIFFFAVTQNQDRALRPVTEKFSNSSFIGINHFGDHQLPLFWSHLLSLPFFPLIIIKFFLSNGLERKAFFYVLDMYWLSYGYYIYMRWLFRKYKPSAVVISNDHVLWARGLIQPSAEEGVLTFYLQHASVVIDIFPPLTVDYALLEGEDTLEKYLACGASQSEIHLVGIPRFDKYYSKININNNVNNIGVCVGARDSEEQLLALCEVFNVDLTEQHFILRPHPSDPRKEKWRNIASSAGWGFSDGKGEDAFQFLSQVDVILAGDSNILLEATLLNILPIYYDFSGNHLDWYGFHKNGLVEYFSDAEVVTQHIKSLMMSGRPYVRAKAKRYCVTIDTEYDGRSTELCVQLIKQIITSA